MVFVFVDCDEGAGECDFSYQGQFFYLTKYLNVFCCKDADRILCSGLTGIKLDLNNTQRGNHIYFFILN